MDHKRRRERALCRHSLAVRKAKGLEETNLTLYPPGTLVMAMYGEGQTRGRATELRMAATTNQALAALVLIDRAADLRAWLRVFLEQNYERIRMSASGGVQPNLNLSVVRSVEIPVPPRAEQVRIVAEVERLLSDSSEAGQTVATAAIRSQRLRQSILKWAFEGKLVDQDPSDEPASVLLERIRAERAARAENKGRKAAVRRKQ
jgi:type I restriction enzyme S subunit